MVLTLLAALLLSASPQDVAPAAGAPRTYAVYVWSDRGRCTYQTGDVLFDAAQFREDLKDRFDPANDMVVFVENLTPPACVEKAKAIARDLGFRNVSAKPAPADLDMGPPRGPAPAQPAAPR